MKQQASRRTRNLLGIGAVGTLTIALLFGAGTAQKAQAQNEPHPPPPTPKVKNYLIMAPGQIEYVVGGAGTGSGYIGKDWEDNSTLITSIDTITNYIARSALQERVLLLERFTPVNGQAGSSTSAPVTISTNTSGHFKILVLRRAAKGETRPTGKSSLLVTLNAQATSFAYPPGAFPTAYPVLPDGTSHKASLHVQIGKVSKEGANPSQSLPSSEVGMEGKQLITLDWDQASKCEGEDDIYAIEVDTQAVKASATATIEGVYANPQVNAGAQAQTDNRSVSISSSTIEPSYSKLADIPYDGTLGPVPDNRKLHVPNADGSKIVDSAVHLSADGTIWFGSGEFQAQASNFSAPSYKWSLSGGAADSPVSVFGRSNFSNLDHAGEYINVGDAATPSNISTKQSTVTLEVKDRDGVIGQNTMTINWHLPYEKTEDLLDGPPRRDLYWVNSEPIEFGNGRAVGIIPATSFDYKAAINGVLVLADVAHVPGASEIEKVFKVVTDIPNWSETTQQINVEQYNLGNNSDKFRGVAADTPQNIDGMTLDTTAWINFTDQEVAALSTDYYCFVGRVRLHHTKNSAADKYNVNGYVSSNHVLSYDTTDRHKWETFYVYKGDFLTPPSLGDKEVPHSYNVS